MMLLAVLAVGVAFWALVQLGRRADAEKRVRRGAMPLAEARALLGVGEGASAREINDAWRRLMARAHPDQGGTEGLAAQLNAARDSLLNAR